MKYYHQLARRGMECKKFDVPYPLPRQDMERDRRRQFVLDSCSFMSEFCRDRNPDAGAVQRDRQGLERCDDWLGGSSGSEETSQEQFVLGLCCMAASAQAGRPHVVTFFCFWLLLGPHFLTKNLKEKIWRQKFRSPAFSSLPMSSLVV